RRFARGLEMPLVFMAVLSPTLLPSFNLMLDVPALALGLTAVVLFIRAADRSSRRGALVAGLVARLAMQTQYTPVPVPGLMLLYAWLSRRRRLVAHLYRVDGSCSAILDRSFSEDIRDPEQLLTSLHATANSLDGEGRRLADRPGQSVTTLHAAAKGLAERVL